MVDGGYCHIFASRALPQPHPPSSLWPMTVPHPQTLRNTRFFCLRGTYLRRLGLRDAQQRMPIDVSHAASYGVETLRCRCRGRRTLGAEYGGVATDMLRGDQRARRDVTQARAVVSAGGGGEGGGRSTARSTRLRNKCISCSPPCMHPKTSLFM